MNKISLIIAREYLTRVRKKSFIIMTFVGPMFFALMFIVPTWLATRGGDEKTIQVIDESGLFQNSFEDTDELIFNVVSIDPEAAKQELRDSENVFISRQGYCMYFKDLIVEMKRRRHHPILTVDVQLPVINKY